MIRYQWRTHATLFKWKNIHLYNLNLKHVTFKQYSSASTINTKVMGSITKACNFLSFISKAFMQGRCYDEKVLINSSEYWRKLFRSVRSCFKYGWNYTIHNGHNNHLQTAVCSESWVICNLCSLTCWQLLSLGLISAAVSILLCPWK